MLIIHLSLAAIAVLALMLRPRHLASAAIVAVAAAIDLGLGSNGTVAITVVAPLIGFLTAALTLASAIAGTGLIERAAASLARLAGGSGTRLYVLVCLLCAALTAVISLDGAVVLMVPLVLALHRRYGAPLAPGLLGLVAVANTASIALPQGNPTNLVVISHLHLSTAAFTTHMIGPGLAAAALSAAIVWFVERHELDHSFRPPASRPGPLTPEQRAGAIALGTAALAAWLAPFLGVVPWWPFIGVVVVALVTMRRLREVTVPWRIAVQIAGLVIVVQALGISPPGIGHPSLWMLLAVAFGTGAVAATINNLPASVWAAGLLSAGTAAYGASIGLAIGALAAPQGSVATLIAGDLAGEAAPPALRTRRLAPLAIAATLAATLLLRLAV